MKKRPNLTFNGINRPNDKNDSYKFKHNELLMDKPVIQDLLCWNYGKY